MNKCVTVEQEVPVHVVARPLRIGSALLGVVLLLTGFAGGVYWGSNGHSPGTMLILTQGASPVPENVEEIESSGGPSDPAVLEARLTEQIRFMHSEIARLDEEAKEGRIHYNLLLQRGYSKDDGACVTLVSRQQEIKERIAQLKDNARDADALRQRLVTTIKTHAVAGNTDGLDESLRAEVLRLINRTAMPAIDSAVIPNTAWIDHAESTRMERINDD